MLLHVLCTIFTHIIVLCSLYPSVLCGYKLCFRNVVYDKKWLTDPRATIMYVPLNDHEAVAFVTHYDNIPVETITDKITAVLMMERKRIRKAMKSVTDPFKLASMDAQQLSCKVLQNSCYGYLGSLMAQIVCTAIAASVCAIAGYMNLTCRDTALEHGFAVVYGTSQQS